MKKELSPWGRQCKVQMLVLGKSLEQLSRETTFAKPIFLLSSTGE